MRSSLLAGFALFSAFLGLLACGSEQAASTSSSSGMPEASDGKFHPPGSGMQAAEADACAALTAAQSQARTHLGCAGTSRTCPDFLRATSGVACLQYDQGTVQGCIDYYNQAKTCDELNQHIGDCVVAWFPDTMSPGCTM